MAISALVSAMSVSSQTTLISPTSTRVQAPHHTNSTTSLHLKGHAHPTHHTKRRASNHANHSHHAGPSRRSSEVEHSKEQGKRAFAAGLAMHVLDPPGKGRQKSVTEVSYAYEECDRELIGWRPLTKASRSDTHLPRLSRTTSMTSNSSEAASHSRPQAKTRRKRSGESVQVLSEDGAGGEVIESEEDGWESGDGEAVTQDNGKKKSSKNSGAVPLRRTASDSQANTARPSPINTTHAENKSAVSPIGLPLGTHHASHTTRTTGFAGSVHAPDPQVAAQTSGGEFSHHYNDPTHIMPAHQIQHQKSARSLASLAHPDENGAKQVKNGLGGDGKPPYPKELPKHMRQRSTDGSGLPDVKLTSSPSFPFPRLASGSQASPTTATAPSPSGTQPSPRRREASGRHSLRHKTSNSSLRSMQSLRAPPHPLNSPTGYRSVMLPSSRPGSNANSPQKGKRGPSMHHPPIAPPVVYREIAVGTGWDIPENEELEITRLPQQALGETRKPSFSSVRSLQGALGRPQSSPSQTQTSATLPPQPTRRKTALEVASAASKLSTTSDPVVYHHSLGFPSTSAETAHLISRFLPSKKIIRPAWEISITERNEGSNRTGLPNGEYREAHESLIRSMKSLGVEEIGSRSSHRLGSRKPSSSIGLMGGEEVGMVKGRNGPMVVARGGWRGRTPFELSVERCLAQRPRGAAAGVVG